MSASLRRRLDLLQTVPNGHPVKEGWYLVELKGNRIDLVHVDWTFTGKHRALSNVDSTAHELPDIIRHAPFSLPPRSC